MKTGVYQIKHVPTGRVYVGSSVNIARRLEWHRNALRRGDHHSRKLQRAWNKYGEGQFEFSVILYCSEAMLRDYEQRLIDGWNLTKDGWNCSKSATVPIIDFTPQMRATLSAALRASAKKHEWRGNSYCIAELSEATGVPAKVLDRRINDAGWSVERAVAEPVKESSPREFTGFGRHLTAKDWARELGAVEATLRRHLSAGKSIEEFARSQKKITIGGLAVLAGQPFASVIRRIKAGWDVGPALMLPPHGAKRSHFIRNGRPGGAREITV